MTFSNTFLMHVHTFVSW